MGHSCFVKGDLMSIRVGIIGPRRTHTGTGPYVARFLRDRGCNVLEWSREDASTFLSGSTPSEVDAVAICSPPATHFEYVSAALRRELHVFCEKPIVWPGDHSPSTLRKLIAELMPVATAARGRAILHENTQWRYTLSDYRRLVGENALNDVREFACELGPSSGTPREMIMEAAPHANSLLLALGCRGMENLSVTFREPYETAAALLEVRFEAQSATGETVEALYRFHQWPNQPRPAAYAVNGQWVRRRIAVPGYRMLLCYGNRETPLIDPLERSVRDFIQRIEEGSRPQREDASLEALRENLGMSAAILERLPAITAH
jgi:hypothetical protein